MKSMSDKRAYIDELRKIVTFRFLSDGEILDLLDASEIVAYEEGETIVIEGEVSPFFFGIVEGTVSVGVKEESGDQVYVSSLGPGDVFGEAGIFMSVKRTATITALGNVLAYKVERGSLVRFIRSYPDAGNKILLVIIFSMLRKLRMVNQELAFERKSDMGQDEIDDMVATLFADN